MNRPNLTRSSTAVPAGATLLAVLFAAPPAVQADYYYSGPDGGSWFDGANWTESESETTGAFPPDGSTDTVNINNGLPGTGVVFDPAAQAGGIMDYQIGRFYISSDNVGPDPVANTLTINSGRLHVTSGAEIPEPGDFYVHLGRHAPGTIIQNGGTFEVEGNIRFADHSLGTASYIYNGGTLNVHERVRLATGAASTSTFTVRNTDPNGSIRVGFEPHPFLSNSDFVVAEGGGSHGTVEFHYENGGVMTIQVGDELSLRNDDDPTVRSARLSLVLEEAPLLDGDTPIDLGLFTTENGTVGGGGTSNPFFYDVTDTIAYTEGALVEATFGDLIYQWTISYTGDIDLSGGTPLITGAGTGNDVVLLGAGVIPEPATAMLATVGLGLLVSRRLR